MSDEKPLHVRVAEALGCRLRQTLGAERRLWHCGCEGQEHYDHGFAVAEDGEVLTLGPGRDTVRRYDTDWSATGPLIERFKIDVRWGGQNLRWWASENAGLATVSGETPLEAVCALLLEIAAAGKLPAGPS